MVERICKKGRLLVGKRLRELWMIMVAKKGKKV